MAFIRRHKLVFVPLFVAAMLGVGAFFLLRSESEEPAGGEAESEPAPGQPLADQVRQLATTGKDPAAAVALAGQWLAANPALTLERQRVHYELGAAYWFAKDYASASVVWRQLVGDYANIALDTTAAAYKVDNALFRLAAVERHLGNRAASIEAYEAFIAAFPRSEQRPHAMKYAGQVYIEDGQIDQGLAMLDALVELYPESKVVPGAILFTNRQLLDPAASPTPEARALNLAVVNANLEVMAAGYPDAPDTPKAYGELLRYYTKRGEDAEAGVAARRMIELFFDARGAKAGDALYSAANIEVEHGDRAIGVAALAQSVAGFPEATWRPTAMYKLARLRAQDGDLAQANALGQALATQYAGMPLESQALHLAVRYWLSADASPTDEARAHNLAVVNATLEALAAAYPEAPATPKAYQDLLRYHTKRGEDAEADRVARRMIELSTSAEVWNTGDALYCGAIAEIEQGDRAKGAAALERFIAGCPGSTRRPDAIYRLAGLRAQDGRFDEARALAQALATESAGTPRHPKALRGASRCLLRLETNGDKEARAQNIEAAKAMIEVLTAKYPDAPETQMAHRDLLNSHVGRGERAEVEPVARRIIELFPGTEHAAKAQMAQAKVIVELRRDFVPAHALVAQALDWARRHNDISLEAQVLDLESYILIFEKRFEEARQAAGEVIKLAEEHDEAAWLHIWGDDRMAFTYFMEKEYEQAAQQYAYALERHADNEGWVPFFKFWVGLAWLYAEEEEKAREAFVRLVQDHPEDAWSSRAFGRMDLGIERPDNLWSPPEGTMDLVIEPPEIPLTPPGNLRPSSRGGAGR